MRWLLSLLLLSVPVCMAQVYRSVAPDGTVSYSDQPSPGARALELPPPSSYTPPSPPAASAAPDSAADAATEPLPGAGDYQRFDLVSPLPDDTIWDNQGAVDVAFDIRPSLRAGDSVRVLVDGAPSVVVQGPVARLQGLPRGTHTLQAELLDGAGRVIKSSSSVTFHLQQHSVNLPARR
jgi:hypothetical protein